MIFRFQVSVGGKADRVLHLPRFVRLIDLRPRESRIAAEGHFFALRLLLLDLGQQQFLPTVGTVDVARAQFRRQAVTLVIEQKQRMIAGGLEVASS